MTFHPGYFALQFGVAAGVVHHLVIQYPRQAALFTTVGFFIGANVIFTLALWFPFTSRIFDATSEFGKPLIVFASSYIATALPLKLIYNISFRHRGLPTKFHLASTDLGYLPMCWIGQSHRQIELLHKTLGDVVRIQPNHISFNSLEAVDAIHGIKTKARKGELYSNVMRLKANAPLSMFSETDKKRHGFLRRIANPFFSQTFLRELEPTIQRYYRTFTDGIMEDIKRNDGVIDMTEWIDHLVLDISGALTLGRDFKCLETIPQKDKTWVLSRRWIFVSRVYAIPWIMPLTWLFPSTRKTREGDSIFREWIVSAMDKLSEEKENRTKSYLEALLAASDPETGEQLSPRQTLLLAVAAADTTATSLIFILYHCIAHKRVWNRLREEVRSKFAGAEEITGQATAVMPYLDAIIHEGTRLRPAAPANLIRETPPEGMLIAGHFIPGNTQVSTPTWTILHDERHFSNPHDFIPERWIDSERGNETCNKKAYIPFSIGLRNCIGKSLAMMQMRVLVATFVWWFDAELVEQQEPLYEDRFVARRGSFKIHVSPVERT